MKKSYHNKMTIKYNMKLNTIFSVAIIGARPRDLLKLHTYKVLNRQQVPSDRLI